MIKNLKLYGRVVAVALLSLTIPTIILVLITRNLMILASFVMLVLILPALLVGFLLFILIQRTKFEKSVNKKNINIICIIIVIIIIIIPIRFYIWARIPTEIIYDWHCDEGQVLCNNGNCSILSLKKGYYAAAAIGPHDGYFVGPNLTFDDRIDFYWGYDNFNHELTIDPHGYEGGGEVILRLKVTSPGKMTTYYVSSNNAPFDAKLFDGITWTGR